MSQQPDTEELAADLDMIQQVLKVVAVLAGKSYANSEYIGAICHLTRTLDRCLSEMIKRHDLTVRRLATPCGDHPVMRPDL